jgi:putative endonuclease
LITQETGRCAEEKALAYLQDKGLKLVERNYSCRLGEIDLIMRDSEYLVFIEVRSRTNVHYGGGLASITYAKRQKIIKTTAHYLIKNRLHDKFPLRFDVVSFDVGSISWLKDAFGVGY